MNDPPTKPKRRRRFSLRFLLIGIAVLAVGLGIWRAVSYRHPAHANLSYEKAPYTSSHAMTVGPNTVSIASIARNRYDGKIHLVSGAGLGQEIPNAQQLKDCAKWLDVVQIELVPGPELVEIIEARVFDHETRSNLSGGNYGWRVVEPNLIQVYGLGKEVPEKLDVWLRLYSHKTGDVYRLSPTVGAAVEVPGGIISVREVTDRYAGWGSKEGFYPPNPESGGESAVLLDWNVDWQAEGNYQFVTVAKTGVKDYHSRCLRPHDNSEWRPPWHSDIPLGMIDHYELRPSVERDVERDRFFFDGLEVPPPVGRKFDPPPKAIINTVAGECQGKLTQFQPLNIHYQVDRGTHKFFSGSTLEFGRRDSLREKLDSTFTLILSARGLNTMPPHVRLKDAQTGQWLLRLPSRSSTTSSTAPGHCGTNQAYRTSLDNIQAIEVSLDVP